MDTGNNVNLPQPEEVTEKEKDNSFGAYIMMFAGAYIPIPFAEIVFSLVYYSYYKKRSRYVAFHAYQSFLSQIPFTIINTALTAYAIVILVNAIRIDYFSPEKFKMLFYYFIVAALLNVLYIIISLVIAFKAKNGVIAYMPFLGRIAYNKLYGPDAIDMTPGEKPLKRNKSPE